MRKHNKKINNLTLILAPIITRYCRFRENKLIRALLILIALSRDIEEAKALESIN
jgi:hypothetical protein